MWQIKYKIIKSFRKSISLQIKSWEIIVKAPRFMLQKTIDTFVQKHKDWIVSRLKQEKNKIIYNPKQIEDLKIKARDYIPNRVRELAYKFWFSYNFIKITSAKTRWGSCTSKKNLNFSYRLILTPKDVIDYVIIHELSHLKHMNHSKRFWREVASMMPDYKKKELWLKKEWWLL